MGHLMTENRNGPIVDARLTEADGTAERATALGMIGKNAGPGSTIGADKNYDTADFVAGCRKICVRPVKAGDNWSSGFLSLPPPPTISFASRRFWPQRDESVR